MCVCCSLLAADVLFYLYEVFISSELFDTRAGVCKAEIESLSVLQNYFFVKKGFVQGNNHI